MANQPLSGMPAPKIVVDSYDSDGSHETSSPISLGTQPHEGKAYLELSPLGYSSDSKEAASTVRERYSEEAQSYLRENATTSDWSGVYGINNAQLSGLVDPKDAYMLEALGGPERLAQMLNTNLETGLVAQQLTDKERSQRIARYGTNVLPEKAAKSLFVIICETLNDKVLIILIVAAIISLALGLYETFGEPPEYNRDGSQKPKVDWVEGVAILVAVIIVTLVGSLNDWQKELQFAKLNRKKENRDVQVLRDGHQCELNVNDVLVGDLLLLQPGDVLPVDGVLVAGSDVECDESSATGESDTLRKTVASTVMTRLKQRHMGSNLLSPQDKKADCMILSGSSVTAGTGICLVTCVGVNSLHGRTLISLQDSGTEITPLQEKLNRIADSVARLGLGAALLLFIILFIKFLVDITKGYQRDLPPSMKGSNFMDIFVVAVTIVVVAVPEGLPLAVTLALAFATTRMIKDNNLVRVFKSCETMGGATTICSDKTGTLTQNKMTVVAATIGKESWENLESAGESITATGEGENALFAKTLAIAKDQILQALVLNSTVFEDQSDSSRLIGSKTEAALIGFCRTACNLPNGSVQTFRENGSVVRVLPFDSARKYMLTIIALEQLGAYRVLVKGAAEILLEKCSLSWTVSELVKMDTAEAERIAALIDNYASKALRPIGIAYKDFTSSEDMTSVKISNLDLTELTFQGLFGIQDPLRPGVKEAVAQCHRAHVVVRMVTGDNVKAAQAIAINAGIISPNDKESIVLEGPQFRKLSAEDLFHVVPKLRVLARSSPQDKRKLVEFLRQHDEVVAVTGDGTNDAPALRLADVGFSMGIAGTEVAKEASDIIIMDDNFASIVNAIKWGRTVNDAVKRFLQFQLTVNITAVILAFVSAVASPENQSALTAVQLLWVNLIMDTLAALGLATDPPVDSVLDRKPDNRKKPLITVTMWKTILGQSFYQICVTFVLNFAGPSIWGVADEPLDSHVQYQLDALVFNAFVWMQFFKLWVSRRIDNKQNILEGISRNPLFWVVAAIIAGFQVLIMFVGGAAFSITRQSGVMWAVALVAGVLAIPVGFLIRAVPDSLVIRWFPSRLYHLVIQLFGYLSQALGYIFYPIIWAWSTIYQRVFKTSPAEPSAEPTTCRQQYDYEWNSGIQRSIEELGFIRKVRGGRASRLRFRAPKHVLLPAHLGVSEKEHASSSDGEHSILASALIAPTIVSGAVGGWSPRISEATTR